MSPLIVKSADIRQLILRACRPYSDPQFRQINRSDRIMVPRLEFFEQSWQPYWNSIRDTELGPNNGYFCELYAGMAQVECQHLAFRYCKENPGVDAAAGLIEVSININEPPFMNVQEQDHCTNLIAYTEDGENIGIAFWESQSEEFSIIPIAEALKTVTLRDVGL